MTKPTPTRSWASALFGAGLLVATLCVGCGGRGGGEAPAAAGDGRGGRVTVGFSSDISGVNPLLSLSNTPSQQLHRHLFLQLLREQPTSPDQPPSFKPDLARSYEWSQDHKVLTFHLRDDAVWSDGEAVTAEDVRFSWQAQVSPEIAWDHAYMKDAIAEVEVVDPHTVRFHFSRVYSTQLLDLNEDYILPAHVWGRLPFSQWRSQADWFHDHLVTAGPFLLASWKPQQEIVLTRNARFYDPELPYLDEVVIRIVPDQTSQLTQLLAGELDFVEQLSPDDAPKIRADPDLDLLTFWSRSFIYVGWNLRRPLFADRDVRLALTLAIDRQTLVDSIWGEFARVGSSPIVSGVWGHDASLVPHPYDPGRARQILAAEGWRDRDGDGVLDKNGQPFAFELLTNAGNQQRTDATVLIQDQLRRVGIAVRPAVMEFQTFNIRVVDGHFDALVSGWVMPTTLDNTHAFHSREIGTGSNFVAFSDPEMDRLLDQIRATSELADTLPLLYREQEMLHRELPYTILWESQRLLGINRRVRGARPNSLYTLFNLPEWWVAPAR